MIFTRYLYNLDEVRYTFIECLLSKKSIEECYFWIYEYYSSGFHNETWKLMWDIYFEFYSLNYPRMIKKIIAYQKKYNETKDFINVLHIVKNFHRFTKQNDIDYRIFLSSVLFKKKLCYIFKEKSYSKEVLDYGYKEKYENLLIKSMIKNSYASTAYYLNKNMDNPNLMKLLKDVLKSNIKIIPEYSNTFNQLMFNILKNNNNGDYYYKKAKINDFKTLLKTDTPMSPIKKDKYELSQIYKTLKQKRKYSISKNIGCFELERYKYNLNNMFWYNWEYFAYKSPLWKKRFDKYKIKVDDKNKKIIFLDEEQEEKFYEEYNYEPDEQSKETQEKSTLQIKKISYKKWLKLITH